MKKTKSKAKRILEWVLLAIAVIMMALALLDYFYIPFTINKTLAIIICCITMLVYGVIEWDDLK